LQVTRFNSGGPPPGGPLTYSLFDVSTPAATLNANDGTNLAIWGDLGTGTTFGRYTVHPGEFTEVLSFPLNSAGIAAANAARGGFFSVGGSVAEDGFFIFGAGGAAGTQQLVLTCVAAPATKNECKNGGWKNFPDLGFKNQGDCVSYVATHGKNPPAGSK
jgi:hypothetical protein